MDKKRRDRQAAMWLQPLSEKRLVNHGTLSLEEFIEFARMRPQYANLIRAGDPETLNKYLASLRPGGTLPDESRVSGRPIEVQLNEGRPHNATEYSLCRYFGLIVDTLNLLESSGFDCRVVLQSCWVSTQRPEINQVRVVLKEHGQALDLPLLSALLLGDAISELYRNRFDQFGNVWAADMFSDYPLKQTPELITIPSMYYRGIFELRDPEQWADASLEWFLDFLHLNFLLQ